MVASPDEQMQYLRSLFSKRGPDQQLPYDEDLTDVIQHHLLGLMQNWPSLLVRSAPFFDNDGTILHLLQADGTLPMTFRGTTYHIPVTIWLLRSYPFSPPRVFVSPTRDMIIRQHHPQVNGSGLVSLPYLEKWVFPDSDLVDLALSLSNAFGINPPLLSTASSMLTHGMGDLSMNLRADGQTSFPNDSLRTPSLTSRSGDRSTSTSVQSTGQTSTSSSSSSMMKSSRLSDENHIDPSEVFQQNAIKAISQRLKQGLEEYQRMQNAEMQKLSVTESLLKSRHKRIMLAVNQQWQEREALEQRLQFVHTNTNLVEEWLKSHRHLNAGEVNIDDVFVPCNALFEQILDASAADLALGDVLYALDEAVQQGCLPIDVYLRQVRAIAREQFYYRAISLKVEAIQRKEKISDMAARYAA